MTRRVARTLATLLSGAALIYSGALLAGAPLSLRGACGTLVAAIGLWWLARGASGENR